MPVLHYYPVLGGLENWTQHIAEILAQEAEIFIVTGKVKEEMTEETRNGVKVVRASLFLLSDLSHSSRLYIFTALPFIFFRSLAIIKKERIDLLHCQGFLSSLLGFFLSRMAKIPYVSTVQRLETNTFLKQLIYRKSAFCIAVSMAVKRYFEKAGVKNIAVIPNGIDLSRFQGQFRLKSRERFGLQSEFAVMTVARLEKVKGIRFLIDAVRSLSCKLLIIGDGSERKNLELQVTSYKLQDKVRFLGQVENEKVPEYLTAADCFVLPSLREGFGIAILEAMAAGAPVVASDIGGIPDIIENGVTGLLSEPGNPESIAKAIGRIYSDPALAKNLVESAKARLSQYDWQNIARQTKEIYRKAVQKI